MEEKRTLYSKERKFDIPFLLTSISTPKKKERKDIVMTYDTHMMVLFCCWFSYFKICVLHNCIKCIENSRTEKGSRMGEDDDDAISKVVLSGHW